MVELVLSITLSQTVVAKEYFGESEVKWGKNEVKKS